MEEEKKESKGGNTRIPFGLCAKYGIQLPEHATPKDAWAALGKKGISPEEGYASLDGGKSYKQGTTYNDIVKNDTASELNELGKKTSEKEYGGKGLKESDNYEDNKNKLYKKANEAGLNISPWEADDLADSYDGDYSDESINDFVNSVKNDRVKDDAYSNIVKNDNAPIEKPSLQDLQSDLERKLSTGMLGNDVGSDSLVLTYSPDEEDKSEEVRAYLNKRGYDLEDAGETFMGHDYKIVDKKEENPVDSQMEDLSKKMLSTAAEYSKYKAGTPEYDKVDKEYNDLASQYEKLQKSKYSKLRSDEPFKNKAKANKSTAKTGPKVHEEFIDYLKHDIGVDLSNARDTQFDNRKMFNIDTREITPDKLRDLKNYATRTQSGFSGYDVKVMDNGAYRLGIQVTKR